MSRKHGAACTTYCTAAAPRRAQTSRRRCHNAIRGPLRHGRVPAGLLDDGRAPRCLPPMTFFLWPPANQLEPAHQPDRLDGSLLIGIYSAVIASILYAVAADSEASEREERRRRGAPLQLPLHLHEPHKNRL